MPWPRVGDQLGAEVPIGPVKIGPGDWTLSTGGSYSRQRGWRTLMAGAVTEPWRVRAPGDSGASEGLSCRNAGRECNGLRPAHPSSRYLHFPVSSPIPPLRH